MTFRQLLLATSAIVLLGLPHVAHGQPGRDNGSDKKADRPADQGRGGQGGPQRTQRPAAPQAEPAPQAQARPQRQAEPQAQASPQRQDRPQRQARPERQAAPQAGPQTQARPQRQAAPQDQARPQSQTRFQNGQTAPNQAPRAASHSQQATQWHSTNPDWNRGTVWQRNPNWWRANSGFRNYGGVRLNFFFAPGYGYYSVSHDYWGRSWHPGEYLPAFFLRYVVNDYRDYGLPAPPYGCSWIWVNTSVLLVDRTDGYILDEVDNVW